MHVEHPVLAAEESFRNYYEAARTGLLALLDDRAPPTRVLEVGCGGGANLGELKRRFPGVRTCGVEVHAGAAAAARAGGRADEVVIGDVLDAAAVSFTPGAFDLIILSHVLEHLAQPEAALARCRGWLAHDGRMLVALPNLRHFSVLAGLLFAGDFRYRDDGILDRTHLRFYTRRSAERMLESQGWRIVERRGDVAGRRSRLADLASLGLAREFTAYAFNFLVVRS